MLYAPIFAGTTTYTEGVQGSSSMSRLKWLCTHLCRYHTVHRWFQFNDQVEILMLCAHLRRYYNVHRGCARIQFNDQVEILMLCTTCAGTTTYTEGVHEARLASLCICANRMSWGTASSPGTVRGTTTSTIVRLVVGLCHLSPVSSQELTRC